MMDLLGTYLEDMNYWSLRPWRPPVRANSGTRCGRMTIWVRVVGEQRNQRSLAELVVELNGEMNSDVTLRKADAAKKWFAHLERRQER